MLTTTTHIIGEELPAPEILNINPFYYANAEQEELLRLKRSLDTEKEKANEMQSKALKAEDDAKKYKNELDAMSKDLENLQARAADDEMKQSRIRAQAQKTTKEAFKFVKEISELSRLAVYTYTNA
jgi:hypothetical protein